MKTCDLLTSLIDSHHFERSTGQFEEWNGAGLMMDEREAVRALAALAQPIRLQVYRGLVAVGRAGMTPGSMVEALGISANTLSFHLKELVNAGLVTHDRDGRFLIYRAAHEPMNELLGYLVENCCQGDSCDLTQTFSCGD